MKKIISQISLILLIMSIGMLSVFITNVNADSVAGLNCPSSVNLGNNFTVALILPSNAYSAQAVVTVKFSDGTSSSQNLVYMNGMNDFPNSVTINAKVAGQSTVTVSGIVISDSSGNTIESGGSKSATMNIVGNSSNEPATPTEPNNNNNANSNNNGANNADSQVSFSDVNETVYTTERCNVRKSYSTNSEKITTLSKGATVKRTGISSSGWSRVEYNGAICYISSQYLTTTKPVEEEVKFKDTNETVYAKQNCNLRKSWSTESDKVGYLTEGQEINRTGIADNGWSRINYNGQVVYVASKLLSTEKIETENETEEPETENTEETGNQEKTEEEILSEIKEEVGVLPEVGNNIATILYEIVTSISMVLVLVGIYCIKNERAV